MCLRSGLQGLLDLGLQHGADILRGHGPDQLVGDLAVTPDDEGLGHAVDAPFDRGAAVAVGADDAERVAVATEETARVVRRVLVIDADNLQPLVGTERGQ